MQNLWPITPRTPTSAVHSLTHPYPGIVPDTQGKVNRIPIKCEIRKGVIVANAGLASGLMVQDLLHLHQGLCFSACRTCTRARLSAWNTMELPRSSMHTQEDRLQSSSWPPFTLIAYQIPCCLYCEFTHDLRGFTFTELLHKSATYTAGRGRLYAAQPLQLPRSPDRMRSPPYSSLVLH